MAPSSEISPLIKSPVRERFPFPLGLVSTGVRLYLELIRFHRVRDCTVESYERTYT